MLKTGSLGRVAIDNRKLAVNWILLNFRGMMPALTTSLKKDWLEKLRLLFGYQPSVLDPKFLIKCFSPFHEIEIHHLITIAALPVVIHNLVSVTCVRYIFLSLLYSLLP